MWINVINMTEFNQRQPKWTSVEAVENYPKTL